MKPLLKLSTVGSNQDWKANKVLSQNQQRERREQKVSKETTEWLNTQTLIGMSDVRGPAWHRDEEMIAQIIAAGGEDNHYPGAIPPADAIRRLFNWVADESGLFIPASLPLGVADDGSDDGSEVAEYVEVPGYKAIVRSDTGAILGIHRDGYSTDEIQQYSTWLVEIATRFGLPLTSAGLLKGGAQAWAQFGLDELQETPSGVKFLANLLMTASWDGSLGNGYRDCITNVVCDNTLSAGLGESAGGVRVSVKHTKNSAKRVEAAGEALEYVLGLADRFATQVEALCSVSVSDEQWADIVAELAPMPDVKSETKTKEVQGIGLDGKPTVVMVPVQSSSRGETLATRKRETLDRLYRTDPRCAPWSGSAFGVVQTANTYAHHSTRVNQVGGTNGDRNERNMGWTLAGKFESVDADALAAMAKVGVPLASLMSVG